MTHPLFNYVHMQEVAPCSQPLNYQPHAAGTLQRLALACCKDSAKPCKTSPMVYKTKTVIDMNQWPLITHHI